MTAGLMQMAQAAQRNGNIPEAERLYREALKLAPEDAQVSRQLALFLLSQGALAESETYMARAVRLLPDEPYMHQNHALVLCGLKRYDEAIAAATRAIKLDEKYAMAYFNRANAYAESGQLPQALRDYERAETRGLKEPALYFAMGFTLGSLQKRDEALTAYDRAIALKPDFLEAIVNRGILLAESKRSLEALAAFDRALAINPQSPVVLNMRGMALYELKRHAEAAECYRAALALAPDYAKACFNFGILLGDVRQHQDAKTAFDRAYALDQNLPWVLGHCLDMRLQLCDWKDYDALSATILSAVDAGRPVIQPFQLALLPATPAQAHRAAQLLIADKCPPQVPLFAKKRAPGRLRLGYLSKDFNNHATAVLFTEVLEQHDRESFEVFAFSHGVDDASPERARLASAVEHFIDVKGLDDRAIALKMKEANIDIAIDLDGHTKDSRPAILSHRPAPLQASYLAFPGTTGADFIDYLLGDAIVTPPEDAPFYAEKVIALSGSYQCNGTRPDPPRATRAEAGLPETGFVFGCFNNAFKIDPVTFDSWMRILTRVPGSILWLLAASDTAMNNLRREADARGVDPARLIFAPKLDLAPHLARLKQMDVMLDTFNYGAHTTASDALWAGVPVVTKQGAAFPARVAASLLTTLGLPDLITADAAAYENLAVTLAGDATRLSALKDNLQNNRSRLFDAARHARHLEQAFRQIWAAGKF